MTWSWWYLVIIIPGVPVLWAFIGAAFYRLDVYLHQTFPTVFHDEVSRDDLGIYVGLWPLWFLFAILTLCEGGIHAVAGTERKRETP